MLMSITPSIIHGVLRLGCSGQVASIIVAFTVCVSYSGLEQACINKLVNVQHAWTLKGFILISEQDFLLSVPTSSPLYSVHHQFGISTHKRIWRPQIISKTASWSKMDSTQFPQGDVMCEQSIIWKKCQSQQCILQDRVATHTPQDRLFPCNETSTKSLQSCPQLWTQLSGALKGQPPPPKLKYFPSSSYCAVNCWVL